MKKGDELLPYTDKLTHALDDNQQFFGRIKSINVFVSNAEMKPAVKRELGTYYKQDDNNKKAIKLTALFSRTYVFVLKKGVGDSKTKRFSLNSLTQISTTSGS